MERINYYIGHVRKNLSIKVVLKLFGFAICIYLILEGLRIMKLGFIEFHLKDIGISKEDLFQVLHYSYLGGVAVGTINSYWIHRKRSYQRGYCIQQALEDGILSPFLFMGTFKILLSSPLMDIVLAKLNGSDSYIVTIPVFILLLFALVALPLIKTKKIFSEDKITENQIRSDKEVKKIKMEGK